MEAERQRLAEDALLVLGRQLLHFEDRPRPFLRRAGAVQLVGGEAAGGLVEIARAVAGAPGEERDGEGSVLDGTEVEREQRIQPGRRDLGRNDVVRGARDRNASAEAPQRPGDTGRGPRT